MFDCLVHCCSLLWIVVVLKVINVMVCLWFCCRPTAVLSVVYGCRRELVHEIASCLCLDDMDYCCFLQLYWTCFAIVVQVVDALLLVSCRFVVAFLKLMWMLIFAYRIDVVIMLL